MGKTIHVRARTHTRTHAQEEHFPFFPKVASSWRLCKPDQGVRPWTQLGRKQDAKILRPTGFLGLALQGRDHRLKGLGSSVSFGCEVPAGSVLNSRDRRTAPAPSRGGHHGV